MNVLELRLYNFVGCKISNDAGAYQITAFPEWTDQPERPVTINRCPKQTVLSSQIKEIKLNEKWLTMFGFEKTISGDGVYFRFLGFELEEMHFANSSKNGYYFGDDLKIGSVSQLQNLFFAIKREELNILNP